MENKDLKTESNEDVWKKWEESHRRGKIVGGIFVVLAGSLFLAKELGAQLPDWLFTWQMLLIAIGIVSAIKHKFQRTGWLVLIAVGSIFMIDEFYPAMAIKPLLWPILIIIVGFIMILKPRRHRHHWGRWRRHHRGWGGYEDQYRNHYENRYGKCNTQTQPSTEDFIDATVVFGAVQKNIISKDFKGGNISIVFGGAEINLSQADFTGTATLEISQVFGGTQLIIPPTWKLRSELESVMGSIEDKRSIQALNPEEPEKILILKGSVVMGGIDIKSY